MGVLVRAGTAAFIVASGHAAAQAQTDEDVLKRSVDEFVQTCEGGAPPRYCLGIVRLASSDAQRADAKRKRRRYCPPPARDLPGAIARVSTWMRANPAAAPPVVDAVYAAGKAMRALYPCR
jgi:hypothetical protein